MSLIKALRGFPQGARTWGKSTAAAGQTSLGKLWANNPLENKYHFIPTQCNWPPHIRSTIDPNGSINSYINSISFPRSFSQTRQVPTKPASAWLCSVSPTTVLYLFLFSTDTDWVSLFVSYSSLGSTLASIKSNILCFDEDEFGSIALSNQIETFLFFLNSHPPTPSRSEAWFGAYPS